MKTVQGKAGETRSVLRREYLLHAPDSFVRTPMPSIRQGFAVVHASPRLGAGFLAYTVELKAGGEVLPVDEQRLFWVLSGAVSVYLQANQQEENVIRPGAYAFLPSGFPVALKALETTQMMVIEKRYEALPGIPEPKAFTQHEADVAPVPLGGDPALLVRSLLPPDVSFDFAVNTMEYAPGASLAQVEVHVMEHGLLMLEGEGTYLLGGDRHFVQAGDFIWMAPFCPQWFVAEGDKPAKYLIYKDWNRRPRL